MRKTNRFGVAGLHLVLIAGVLISVGPLIWAISSSFKGVDEIFVVPPRIFPENPTVSNYTQLSERVPFFSWFWNSIWIAAVTTVIGVFLSALGGYGFAKYQFRGRNFLLAVVLSSIMIPFVVILIPLYILMAQLGWTNSYLALIVPWVTPAFGIFMMRQYIQQSIPNELLDAGRIDGASEFGIFVRIVLPLLRAPIATLSVWFFLNSYNMFLWPLSVMQRSERFTLPVGLASILGNYNREYGLVIAGAVMAAIPTLILFFMLRKQFIEGLTAGAVK